MLSKFRVEGGLDGYYSDREGQRSQGWRKSVSESVEERKEGNGNGRKVADINGLRAMR